jgi:hypothetical protein
MTTNLKHERAKIADAAVSAELSLAEFWERQAEKSESHEEWKAAQDVRIAHFRKVEALLNWKKVAG